MLNWEMLLSTYRRKDGSKEGAEDSNTGGARVHAERDYDRILFANPTRRLADKTQVFPLEVNDSIRTRLTHSMEVSNLARSIGVKLAFDYPEKAFGVGHEKLQVKRTVPAMLAAIGLAHDLGNPPFGHQGEEAVKHWFKHYSEHGVAAKNGIEKIEVHKDFTHFDGNPQTFRLLTKLQILNDNFGLNLTCGTLAALIKYPWFSNSASEKRFSEKKFGVFESEREVVLDIWARTGLQEGVRHPLTYIMEACDDIAYLILDAEDTIKKGYASFYDLMAFLKHNVAGDPTVDEITNYSQRKNSDFLKESLTSSELNEISMQMFRVISIYHCIESVTETFLENIESIMRGEVGKKINLIELSRVKLFCKAMRDFDKTHGFSNRNVLRLELRGNRYIERTMDMLWVAIKKPESPFSKYAITQISENYKRARRNAKDSDVNYLDCQLLSDSIAGMTDGYLVSTCKNLRKIFRK